MSNLEMSGNLEEEDELLIHTFSWVLCQEMLITLLNTSDSLLAKYFVPNLVLVLGGRTKEI